MLKVALCLDEHTTILLRHLLNAITKVQLPTSMLPTLHLLKHTVSIPHNICLLRMCMPIRTNISQQIWFCINSHRLNIYQPTLLLIQHIPYQLHHQRLFPTQLMPKLLLLNQVLHGLHIPDLIMSVGVIDEELAEQAVFRNGVCPNVLDYGGWDHVVEGEVVEPDEEGVDDVVLEASYLVFFC
jgi:hypothetical protein